MTINYGNQTLGRGEVRFSEFKPNSFIPNGFRYFGNTPDFSLSSSATMLDHYNSDHGIKEKDISIPVQVDRTAKFSADDIQVANVGYFFFGSSLTIAQTSAVGVAETLTDVIVGLSYQLGITAATPAGLKGITNLLVKVATVTKTAGTDYVFDADRGILTVLAGGTIVSGTDDLVLTYDRVANSYDQIVSGSTPITGALQFIADNPQGANIDYLMRYVRLTPSGDFALKADSAWQSLPFSVEILRAPGLAAIYANGQPYVPA